MIMVALKCLSLLLVTKTKDVNAVHEQMDPDNISHVIKFVQVKFRFYLYLHSIISYYSMVHHQLKHQRKTVSHILSQYFISIRKTLLFECQDLPTSVLMLLASYYIFNLAYTARANNFYRFIQEKFIGIPSDESHQLLFRILME